MTELKVSWSTNWWFDLKKTNLLLTIQLYLSGKHAKLMLPPVCQCSAFHCFTSLNCSDRSHVKKSPWAQSNCVTSYGKNNEWFMKLIASAWHDWDVSAQVILNYSCNNESMNRFLALIMDCTVNEESLGSALLVRQKKTFEDVTFMIFHGQSKSCKNQLIRLYLWLACEITSWRKLKQQLQLSFCL